MAISVLTILFQLYNNTSSLVLAIFNCTGIEGVLRLQRDMDLRCWTSNHMRWAFGFGIPYTVLFILGLPILGIVFLTINRKRIESPRFIQYFIVMYQGY